MIKYHQSGKKILVAELTDDNLIISQVQDVLDLLADIGLNDCNRIIIREKNFHPDFFNLKTGIAGEILQKFSNYSFKLAIIGDFSKYTGKSIQDFMHESNRGNIVFFMHNIELAILKLTTV